jgi:hypothetical protein
MAACLSAAVWRHFDYPSATTVCRVVERPNSSRAIVDLLRATRYFDEVTVVPPFPGNNYLNKFHWAEQWANGSGHVCFMDNDILPVGDGVFPLDPTRIGIRLTPRLVWQRMTAFRAIHRLVPPQTEFVNSGLIVCPQVRVGRFVRAVVRWHRRFAGLKRPMPDWFREQSAVAMAIDQLGGRPLSACLNYTLGAPRPPTTIILLHYNGDSAIGRTTKEKIEDWAVLKCCLLRGGVSEARIKDLKYLHAVVCKRTIKIRRILRSPIAQRTSRTSILRS